MSENPPELNSNVQAAAWIAARLDRRGSVTSWVPAGFAAYARILHPAQRPDGRPVTWAQVAIETGRLLGPDTAWHALVGSTDPLTLKGADWVGQPPAEGLVPRDSLSALLKVLATHTSTPDSCWMCLWEGYGWVSGMSSARFDPNPPRSAWPNEARTAARVHLNREYLLLHGTLGSALALEGEDDPDWQFAQSPNLLWPEDRAWVVSTEIDDRCSLVAGNAQLVADLVASDGLEVWPV